jgi:signal transduction histidine kinase
MPVRLWWYRHGDAVFAVAVLVAAQFELAARHPDHDLVGVLRGGVLVVCTLPLAWRRRWPLMVTTVTAAFGSVATAASGDAAPFYAVTAAALVMFYSAGAYASTRSWLAPVIGCAAFWTDDLVAHHPVSEYVASTVLVLGPWLAGHALRLQRTQSARLRQLTAELAQERDRAEVAATQAERARIAREMHDVVAHALTIIAVQSDAASAALAVDSELVKSAVDAIHQLSRESLQEMRRVLHVLHDDDPNGQANEPPTLRDLDRLVGRVRCAGLTVELTVRGRVDDLPAGLDLTAYRVVQEALTNVGKHAAAAHANVLIDRDSTRLIIDVRDNGKATTSPSTALGYGLRGLRERVTAHGGCLDAGIGSNGYGWQVLVDLPMSDLVTR